RGEVDGRVGDVVGGAEELDEVVRPVEVAQGVGQGLLGLFRHDQAGGDGVAPDAVATVRGGDVLGQGEQCALDRSVARGPDVPEGGGPGGRDDDRSAAGCLHVRDDGLRQV